MNSLEVKANPLKPSDNLTKLKVYVKSFEHPRKSDRDWSGKHKYTGPLVVTCTKCGKTLNIPDDVRSFTCDAEDCFQELVIE